MRLAPLRVWWRTDWLLLLLIDLGKTSRSPPWAGPPGAGQGQRAYMLVFSKVNLFPIFITLDSLLSVADSIIYCDNLRWSYTRCSWTEFDHQLARSRYLSLVRPPQLTLPRFTRSHRSQRSAPGSANPTAKLVEGHPASAVDWSMPFYSNRECHWCFHFLPVARFGFC